MYQSQKKSRQSFSRCSYDEFSNFLWGEVTWRDLVTWPWANWVWNFYSLCGKDVWIGVQKARSTPFLTIWKKLRGPLNLRPAGGPGFPRPAGGGWDPLRFFQISKNAPPFLAHLMIHLFCTYCENFTPRSCKVRSPGHTKGPHLIKSLNVHQSYTDWTIDLKL